jgi:tripartite ATP-independent transporter DctM subunit
MMAPVEIGILGIVLMLILIALKVPVGFALIGIAILGNIMLTDAGPALSKVGSDLIIMVNNYSLSVIPLFVLMGIFLSKAGVAADLYNVMSEIFKKVRGGMAIATLGAAAVFGAVCGSATAAASTIGSIAVPEMTKHQYNQGLSASIASVGATLGIIIPPSTTLILYGVITEESIGQVLIAGLLPGIMLTVMLMITTYILLLLKPSLGPPVMSKQEHVHINLEKIKYVWPLPVIFVISIGGIYAGYFTPTEAGAAGAFLSLVLVLIMRRLSWSKFVESISSATTITAMVFAIVIGGKMFGIFLTRSRIPFGLSDFINSLQVSPFIIILIILLIYTLMGFFMDELATIVIMTPIFYPIILELGYNAIWFGVMTTMMNLTGLLTPPVGVASLVVAQVTKVPTGQVFRYQVPFWITLIIGAIIVALFPDIALFLPSLMY